ncbi:hypothetical protein BBK82_43625 [Lentzea guizhouensis]|uniref:PPE family domain-containing protein n=1 Tax=Lentzea guizhouensis TaxID=1586287 RepID=A0A1B2HVQ5_9PSEU|nr:hypothetical protein [Lentzea guizhouensis]ANZ41811.1 hypothetical protein BBK82_43625 [Lentzea guizhouensis]
MNEAPGGPSGGDVYSRFGLERHGEVQTAQQLHDQVVAANVATHGPIVGPLLTYLQGNGQLGDLLEGQSKNLLDQGVPPRQAPAAPGVHYLAIPHAQLYEMVNNSIDPGAVGAAGDTYTQIGNKLTAFQDRIARAIGNSETEWVGVAADEARKAVAGLGNKASKAGTAAQLAGTLITQQSRASSTAKSSVPPPPAHPYDHAAANARRMAITDPLLYIQQAAADMAAYQEQKRQHEEAARVVETYDRTIAQTAGVQPAFAPAPPAPEPQPQPQPHPVPRPQPPIGNGTGDLHGRTATRPPNIGDTTNTAWTAPPVTDTGGSSTTTTSGLTGGHNAGGGSQNGDGNNHRGGGVSSGLLNGPVGSDRSSSRPGGSGAGAGRGAGAVGGVRGPGGGAGFGAPGSARGVGPGGSSGVLPGEGATGRPVSGTGGTPGSRAGAGISGMGGIGAPGAKGTGDEDIERTAPSYLLEPDPDETFGSDEKVAPPVIGE